MTQQSYPPLVLEPEQYAALTQLATQQHQTISEVAVEIVSLGLEALRQRGERGDRQSQRALESLNAIRKQIQEKHGIYPGDLVAEVRAEREEQILGIGHRA
ncbi:MAG: hypothetical protein F6J93_18400 [Oscillatoria sp. SIO1A7]|nr:hypothetical protein [Oscillatoria sp. SIO1A7]